MFAIVLHGLRGRRRDSLTLGSVLLLSFLFLVASSLLLSSVAFTTQQRRQALYGSWQAMYYNVSRSDLPAYEALEGASLMHLLGKTNEGQLIGSISAAVMEAGDLRLLEGRLPETENEIVVVRDRMGEDLTVGDLCSLRLDYDYTQNQINIWDRYGGDISVLRMELMQEALAEPRTIIIDGKAQETPDWEQCRALFERYIREHFDEETATLQMGYPGTWQYWELSFEDAAELQRLLEEEHYYNYLFGVWVDYWFAQTCFGDSSAFEISTNGAYENRLESAAGFTIRIDGSCTEYKPVGSGYTAEQRSSKRSGPIQTSNLSLYRDYTVVGILAPYADHWDVRGCAMPDAFVSARGVSLCDDAIAYAEQLSHGGVPDYEPRSILLYHDPSADARTAADTLLQIFNAQQRPYYRIEAMLTENGPDPNRSYITGIDAVTGEERQRTLELHQDGYYVDGQYPIGHDPDDPAAYEACVDVFQPLPPLCFTVEDLYRDNSRALRLNSFSYPAAGGTEDSLRTLLSGILMGVVACATFQIFWVQLRRRRARLATLMSIGATDGQVLSMLLLELLLLLFAAGGLGTVLGFGLARLLLGTVVDAVYHPDWAQLRTGLAGAAAAALAGALIPMLVALRTPLTGREPAAKRALHLRQPGGEPGLQRYWRIVLRSMCANRGRTALQCVFAWLLATICLLTVFLCHTAFADYRREVERAARPDYVIEAPYAMSRGFLKEALADMAYEGVCDAAIEGGNVNLSCADWADKSPILRALQRLGSCDGTNLTTRIVGAGEDSTLLGRIMDMIPGGSATEEQILNGEACVVLVPRYLADGGEAAARPSDAETMEALDRDRQPGALLELSFEPDMADLTEADTAIRAGDSITLWAESNRLRGEELVTTRSEATVRVAAVVSILDEPLWPFSGETPVYWILSGDRLVYRIYPNAGTRMPAEQVPYHKLMTRVYAPDCYGHTKFYLTNPAGADGIAQDTAAANFAEAYGLDFDNLRLLNERVESDALKSAMLFLLLGIEMALVVLTILAATAASAVEQDRRRCGVLQAIGVSGGQLLGGQLFQALAVAVLACLAANLTVALALFTSAAVSAIGHSAYWRMLLRNLALTLQNYPWTVHAVVCIACLLIYTAVQTRPIRSVGRRDPIGNIRG